MITNRKFLTWPRSAAIFIALLIGAGWFYGCSGGSGNDGGSVSTANQAPIAAITSPAGSYFNEGDTIVFRGSATDAEDGQVAPSSLVWRSNIDGVIGTGTTMATSALTAEDHDITLSATDSEGDSYTTAPLSIHVEPTRFIKMGFETSGVPDAANAFDGDLNSAARITTSDTELIHFKAYIGSVDTFIFNVKVGPSTPGSRLTIQGLATGDIWQPVSDMELDVHKTVTIRIVNAQNYIDTDSYINLRARWEGGGGGDWADVFEIYRFDPVYSGLKTAGVDNPEAAFDGLTDNGSYAEIAQPWGTGGIFDFLHINAYVGEAETFIINLLLNNISDDQFAVLDVETSPNTWTVLETLTLNVAGDRTVTIPNVQDYLDADGCISIRVRWVGYGTSNSLRIYEIWRSDPIILGTETAYAWISNPESAVDGNFGSFAVMHFFWGELDHYDYLHLTAYVGDASYFSFSVDSALSGGNTTAELFVEGKTELGDWVLIEQFTLEDLRTHTIYLQNCRQYVDSDGFIHLRVRWESASAAHDAYLYEIWRES
jgi:hypothetical protein